MNATDRTSVEARLARLERNNRILLALLFVALALLTAGFKMQVAEKGAIVQAARFELLDEKDRARVVIGMTAEGPVIRVLDASGSEVSTFPKN